MQNYFHNLKTNFPRMWSKLHEKRATSGVYGIGVDTVAPAKIIPRKVIENTLEACLRLVIYAKYLLSLKAHFKKPVTRFPKITANRIVKNISVVDYLLSPTLSTLAQGQAKGKRELSPA